MPIPPRVSPKFYDLVTSIDFYLTDEHSDDNTQLGLLVLADGCALLEHYQKRVFDLGTRLNQTPSPEDSVDLQAEMVELANAYDRELDVTLFTARDALRDVNRRLAEVRFWRQINRPIGELPQGKNPTPISAGDPRLAAEQTEGNT
jgi:hypothetical protein